VPERSKLLVEHNLFGKMASIFPDHALSYWWITISSKKCATLAERDRALARVSGFSAGFG
jgi:hypothetical protein